MSNAQCIRQLIWCETKVEKLEQQLIEWKELARNIDAQLRTELAAETNNKQEFERDWLACCDKLNDERRIHLELEETLVDKLEAAQAREKVLHSLSNELLHQIDINDFTDSHGHSAKMLKAVHDLMKYNTQPSDDTALRAALKAERERCITAIKNRDKRFVISDFGSGTPVEDDCIAAIRTLEDV